MTGTSRRECPACAALVIAPALFCDSCWPAVPDAQQQEIGEAYAQARLAQGGRDSARVRATMDALREALRRGAAAVRALRELARRVS